MYMEYLANYISGGRLIGRDKLASLSLKPSFDRYLTKTSITKAWYIYGIPCNYNKNFSEGLRRELFKEFPNVKVVLHTRNVPASVDVQSRIYNTKLANISRRLQDMQRIYGSARDDQRLTGNLVENDAFGRYRITQDDLQNMKNEKDSLMYVFSEINSGRYLFESCYFIQASAKNYRTLKSFSKKLSGLLRKEGLTFREIKGNMVGYLNNNCPATYASSSDKTIKMLLSEENFASQMPYRTKGLQTQDGLMIALDWQSKLPFFHNPFESSAGQVNMILSKTGWGKTYIAFGIALPAIGFGIHFSAIDIKGDEWNKLAPYADMKVISLDRFVNTMRIDDMPATPENSEKILLDAVSLTSMLIFTMVELKPEEGNKADLTDIIDNAVLKYYAKIGVEADKPETFAKTANMTYQELMTIVSELKNTASFNDSQKEMCNLIRTRCAKFFSPAGRYYDTFKEEITVGEILDTPAIVYSFDKNANGELDLMDSIKVFMCQALDGKKHQIRKSQGKHTFAFYEELQRCVNSAELINYITSRVTGSRSSNVTVYLLLNAVSVFDSETLQQIRSNITTKIIGKVSAPDIEKLVSDFDCGEIKDYMYAINSDENSNVYRNCFAIQYDTGLNTGKAIIKSVLPDDVWATFNTRDRLNLYG